MTNAVDIMKEKGLINEGNFTYVPRTVLAPYEAVEIHSTEDSEVTFKQFFYLVNVDTHQVFYGDYSLPDKVNIARIERGQEKAINS